MPKFPVTCRVQRRFRSCHVIVQKAAAGAAQTGCTVIRALCNGSSGMHLATCVVACKWQVIKFVFTFSKVIKYPVSVSGLQSSVASELFKCFCFVLLSSIVETTVHISKRPCEYAEYSRLIKALVKPCARLLTQRVGANTRNSACRYVFHHCALGNAEFSVWRCWRFHAGSSC